jgi:cytochrome oxidase Cu insertion factor (SCO1/SenC/PrrC family)
MRWGQSAALLALWATLSFAQAPDANPDADRMAAELQAGGPGIGSDFRLRDASGRTRKLSEFRGKVVVLYFGYTFCPDVCPTDLAQVARAIRDLGRAGRDIQPVFVTLDPARDTPALLRRYAKAFHPRLLAVRGSEAEIRAVADAWRQYYRVVPGERPGEYSVEHAAYTYVIDRRGRFREAIPPGTPSRRMAEVFREALE